MEKYMQSFQRKNVVKNFFYSFKLSFLVKDNIKTFQLYSDLKMCSILLFKVLKFDDQKNEKFNKIKNPRNTKMHTICMYVKCNVKNSCLNRKILILEVSLNF